MQPSRSHTQREGVELDIDDAYSGAAQADSLQLRWRPAYLQSMLALEIGQSVDLRPETNDNLDALWKRINRQVTRYRAAGRYFHRYKRQESVLVQRVEVGGRRKLAPFLRMTPGEIMLCGEAFEDERDRKNLRRRLLYLSDLGKAIWIERHPNGNLYYRCYFCRNKARFWVEDPVDDGSDILGAEVVCGPDSLRSLRGEFGSVKRAIYKSREADKGVVVT